MAFQVAKMLCVLTNKHFENGSGEGLSHVCNYKAIVIENEVIKENGRRQLSTCTRERLFGSANV